MSSVCRVLSFFFLDFGGAHIKASMKDDGNFRTECQAPHLYASSTICISLFTIPHFFYSVLLDGLLFPHQNGEPPSAYFLYAIHTEYNLVLTSRRGHAESPRLNNGQLDKKRPYQASSEPRAPIFRRRNEACPLARAACSDRQNDQRPRILNSLVPSRDASLATACAGTSSDPLRRWNQTCSPGTP